MTDVAEDASAPHPYPTEMPTDRITHFDRSGVTVRPLNRDLAAGYLVANHYSGSWNNGSFGLRNFGIYHNRTLMGVAAYGLPMNPKSWPSITSSSPDSCLELNRLFLHDRMGHNAETWFMAKAHDLLRRDGIELIQSFADGRLGNGTIYKAANFTYHGHTETRFFRHNETGHFYHGVPFTNAAASAIIPRNLMLVRGQLTPVRVRTYRYLLPLTRAARKSVLIPALPYPKERLGVIEDPEYTPPHSQVARAAAVAEAMGDSETAREFIEWILANGGDPNDVMPAARANPHVKKTAETMRIDPNQGVFDIL